MSHIDGHQKKITVFQVAENMFSIESEKHSKKQMTPREQRLIMNSLILGVQLERLKPKHQDLINFISEIGENLKNFEELNRMDVDTQKLKEEILDTFLFNPNLKLQILLNQELKSQYKKIEDKQAQKLQEQINKVQKQIEEDASAAYAQYLQDEDDEAERQAASFLLQKPTQCSICQDELLYEERWYLNLCDHSYHRACLVPYFQMKIKEKDLPLRCPEEGCKQDVLQDDLSLILDDTTFTQYNQYTLESAIVKNPKDMSWCPTADCKYAFAFTQGISEFSCPMCTKHYCLSCKIEFHVGQTCALYKASVVDKQSDNQFVAFAVGSKFKQCPQCKHWVEKADGCNYITCRCKYNFCYICGGPYTPKCLCGNLH